MTTPSKPAAPDAAATLGTIIGDHERRDAIHLAVTPAVAAYTIHPGMHVGFLPDGTAGTCENPVGIVDPFLKDLVKKGQRFWLVVYPRQITSLRHVWTHPAFTDEETMAEPPSMPAKPAQPTEKPKALSTCAERSKAWIENFAIGLGRTYEAMMEHAKDYLNTGSYWCGGEEFEGEWVPDEFWSHYETVTGTVVPESNKGNFFTCSC